MSDNVHKTARSWIADLLGGNGFGDDYTNADLDAWADDLLETLGLKNEGTGYWDPRWND